MVACELSIKQGDCPTTINQRENALSSSQRVLQVAPAFAFSIFFLFFRRFVLPRGVKKVGARGAGTVRYLRRLHGVDAAVREIEVPPGSPLVGRDIKSVQREFEVRIVASRYAGKVLVAPPIEAPIAAPATLAVIAQPDELKNLRAISRVCQLTPATPMPLSPTAPIVPDTWVP